MPLARERLRVCRRGPNSGACHTLPLLLPDEGSETASGGRIQLEPDPPEAGVHQ
jgi:hypothetical protein